MLATNDGTRTDRLGLEPDAEANALVAAETTQRFETIREEATVHHPVARAGPPAFVRIFLLSGIPARIQHKDLAAKPHCRRRVLLHLLNRRLTLVWIPAIKVYRNRPAGVRPASTLILVQT